MRTMKVSFVMLTRNFWKVLGNLRMGPGCQGKIWSLLSTKSGSLGITAEDSMSHGLEGVPRSGPLASQEASHSHRASWVNSPGMVWWKGEEGFSFAAVLGFFTFFTTGPFLLP